MAATRRGECRLQRVRRACGRGYATEAVLLLLDHLARTTEHHTATLLINPDNVQSLGVAAKLGCLEYAPMGASRYFKMPIERLHQ